MNKNEVWEEIKNDKSLIYGKPMLDVFLQLTKTLSAKHFLELNKEQIEKLGIDAIVHVLWQAKDIEKVSEMLGTQGFNKLDSGQINYILKQDSNMDAINDIEFSDIPSEKKKEFTRTDAVLKYRTLNDTDVSSLLFSVNNKNHLEKILSVIGKDKLKMFGPLQAYYLINYYLNKQDGFELFKIFIQALGDHINILRPKDVWKFVNYEITKHENIEEMLDLIGNENLKKITNDELNDLQQQAWNYERESDYLKFKKHFEKLVASIKKRRNL